jgi:hypothetical protein
MIYYSNLFIAEKKKMEKIIIIGFTIRLRFVINKKI